MKYLRGKIVKSDNCYNDKYIDLVVGKLVSKYKAIIKKDKLKKEI